MVHNWSWEPATVTVPVHLTDALDGGALPADTAVNLRAWDVRVLAAEPDAPAEER